MAMTSGDLDLRKLRYFMAIVRHGTFSRAAEELHIAQPVLSRQIRALETELDATLLIRDSQGTRLTDAGVQLAADAEPLLADAAALRRQVLRAARAPGTFAIAFMPGVIVADAARQLRDTHPGLVVELIRTGYDNQTEVLHDGRADVAYVRPPVDRHGLTTQTVYAEPRVVALPAGHELGDRSAIEVSELAAERLLQHPDTVPGWPVLAHERDQRRRTSPPRHIPTVEEKLERVALGEGVITLAESMADYYHHPDVVFIALSGVSPAEVLLAWSARRRSPLIAEYAAIAVGGHQTTPA